jgi:hypothetical protein
MLVEPVGPYRVHRCRQNDFDSLGYPNQAPSPLACVFLVEIAIAVSPMLGLLTRLSAFCGAFSSRTYGLASIGSTASGLGLMSSSSYCLRCFRLRLSADRSVATLWRAKTRPSVSASRNSCFASCRREPPDDGRERSFSAPGPSVPSAPRPFEILSVLIHRTRYMGAERGIEPAFIS